MKKYILDEEFILESGKTIDQLEIVYRTFGTLNQKKDNVIWVFHAVSGDTNVMGWWPGLFGKDALYNPESHFIICANTIGSPYGSTKARDLNFPLFTIRDVTNAIILLANHLNIKRIHTLIGGSFGGYQALEFAYSYTGKIDHMILVCSSARESAWGIAIHEAQRMALKADPSFGKDSEGIEGLKAARAMAMLTYRTSENLIARQTDDGSITDDFKASSYINYQGLKFSKRFDALSFHYLSKCIDTHNIGRNRGGEVKALGEIKVPTLVIGFTSDTLVPIHFQRFLANHLPMGIFKEFESQYGHDAFLVEIEKITKSIATFYANTNSKNIPERTILKFGGTSLYGKEQLQNVLTIVKSQYEKDPIALVVSARGKSTDKLIDLFNLAKTGMDYTDALNSFIDYTSKDFADQNFLEQFKELESVLSTTKQMKDISENVYDKVLAFGEIISAIAITNWLNQHDIKAKFIDARKIIFTDKVLGDFEVNMDKSRSATINAFFQLEPDEIPVITGFIASNENGKTVTLGRNGSNYSASLIANFVQAREVQNWTDVDGIYSSNPNLVTNAVKIKKMTYKEANEMANFGMNLLHPKTISPLIQAKIPLVIKSTKNPQDSGTIINYDGGEKGIKAVTTIEDVSLISIEGNELSQKVGIDGRIFSCLSAKNINIKMISQASSENGIGFVVSSEDAFEAELALNKEFRHELILNQISSININNDVGIVAIIGRHNFALEKAISTLRYNGIWMYLISNSITGEHISLVVDNELLGKAAKLVHNEVFGAIKTLHVFAFGKGQVGSAFNDQILNTSSELVEERKVAIKIIGLSDSEKYFIAPDGINSDWKSMIKQGDQKKSIDNIIQEIKKLRLNNIVIVDNTASEEVSSYYVKFLKQNFDIVASNKKFNSSDLTNYQNLRKVMRDRGRKFYYEANVGAGLPIVTFLKSLYNSSDIITKIQGVFSGSLSYIFNNFSIGNTPFSDHIAKAGELGYTEPDPREDLNGLDVARKLVILAREINYPAKLADVEVENLIPEALRKLSSYDDFTKSLDVMDTYYDNLKSQLESDEVLRYVAELDVKKNKLHVGLKVVKNTTPLGQVKNADTHFEIFTESYKDQPIVIQGAGAGPVVTARAVYSDVLRICTN